LRGGGGGEWASAADKRDATAAGEGRAAVQRAVVIISALAKTIMFGISGYY
jgi:hypothetical protein